LTGGERLFVRFATLGVVAGAALGAGLMHVPSKLPSTAMGSVALLFFERFFVVLVALLFLLVALFRGWRGDLPTSISEKGAEWQPLADQTESLQSQIDELLTQIDELRRQVHVLTDL
jgi:hypothetical protein